MQMSSTITPNFEFFIFVISLAEALVPSRISNLEGKRGQYSINIMDLSTAKLSF